MKKSFMLRLKPILLILLIQLLLISIVFSGVAQTGKPIELIFGYASSPGSIDEILNEAYSRRIEEATNGRVKVITYPSGSLFKQKDVITAIENGLTDIGTFAIAQFPGVFNLIEVMFLPFLHEKPSPDSLPSYDVNSRVVTELIEMIPELQEEWSRYKLLYASGQEDYLIATRKKPVLTLEDLKGLKIRIAGRYPSKVISALGGAPVTMMSGDLYDAASKGVVDGSMVMTDNIDSYNIHHVLPYWTAAPFWNSIFVMVMNKEKWESLPGDIQEQIMSVSGLEGAVFQAYVRFGDEAVARRDELQKKDNRFVTMYELSEEEILRWKEIAGPPIWKEWVEEMEEKGLPGQKVLDKAIELYKNYY